MPRDGTRTRTALLDAAEHLVLDRGFSGTAVDDIIDQAGVTKGAFFHHFPTKQDLARALMDRYAELDLGHLRTAMERAEQLASDPLEQLLVFLGLYRELFAELTEPYPGCLMASYISESGLIDDDTLEVARETMLAWRDTLAAKLREVAAVHPPRRPVDLDALADAVTVVAEGAFIVSRTLGEARVTADQFELHRTLVESLFRS